MPADMTAGSAFDRGSRSSTFLQLGYHAIDVERRIAACFGPELLEHVAVFCFQSFLASLGDHPTLDPHFRSFRHGEVRTLRDVERSNLGIAGAQALVEEWLDVMSVWCCTIKIIVLQAGNSPPTRSGSSSSC